MAFPILVDVISSNGVDTDAEKVKQIKDLCTTYFKLLADTSIEWEVVANSMESTTRANAGTDIQLDTHTASSSARTCGSTQANDTESPIGERKS